jgi:GDP-4-dehydro-6-deoxy-D-mannose reductase
VRDTVRAYRLLAESGVPGRAYNVCSGKGYRIADLLDRLIGMASLHVRVETDPSRLRPSDTPAVIGNPARLQADTGWRPEIPIEQTLTDLLDYWREETRRAAAPRL